MILEKIPQTTIVIQRKILLVYLVVTRCILSLNKMKKSLKYTSPLLNDCNKYLTFVYCKNVKTVDLLITNNTGPKKSALY